MIYTVFSTTDTPYMQWQSELLEFSWNRVGQPGELVRLVATDRPDAVPQHREARCVATRPWQIHPFTGDDYSPYNKPASLLEWLYREQPEGTVLLLDPDCVFRRPVRTEVPVGRPIGQHWIDGPSGLGPCGGLEQNFESLTEYCDVSLAGVAPVMIPNLIHTADLRRIAPRWLELTGLIRQHVRNHQDNPMWESDMFAFLLASAEYGLVHEPGTLGACTNWPPEASSDAPVVHYCQPICDDQGQLLWSKGTYQPWQKPAPAEAARDLYGRELLELIEACANESGTLEECSTEEQYPRRRAGVRQSYEHTEMELQIPGDQEPLELNTTAEAIWLLCDGTRSASSIAAELATRFNTTSAEILPDIRRGLRTLEEAGALEW